MRRAEWTGREHEALAAGLIGYDLDRELGRGGWGIVYGATHRKLGRQVAIKILPAAFGADPDVRARFEEEAQFAARLSHPHVVQVYDFLDASGLLVIVMERMTPLTLADRFAQEGILQDTTCALVVAIASALHAAHRLGRVHRDVKPENVLFDSYEVPKLSDFGVAKIIGIGDGLTRAGDVIGTPAYMSPEQASGGTVGPASDVYSTSVVAYELLAGRLPFPPVGSAVAQLYQHVHETPIPLADANPDVAPPIAAAVMRGLARSPAARYDSAESFAAAVGEAATEVYGAGWLRDAGVDVRLTGRLLDVVRGGGRARPAQRLPTLTMRASAGQHPRLGTIYDTGHGGITGPDDVTGFEVRGAGPHPADEPPPSTPTIAPPPATPPAAAAPETATPAMTAPEAATPPTATPSTPTVATPATAPSPPPWSSGADQIDDPSPPRGDRPESPAPERPDVEGVRVLLPFTPSASRSHPRRRWVLGACAIAVVLIVGLVAMVINGGSDGDGAAQGGSTTSAPLSSGTAVPDPAPVTTVLDREGQVLEPALLDDFEVGCGLLGLRGGAPFCRCARERLGGAVTGAEIVEATAFFDGGSPTMPPSVRAVLTSCTTG